MNVPTFMIGFWHWLVAALSSLKPAGTAVVGMLGIADWYIGWGVALAALVIVGGISLLSTGRQLSFTSGFSRVIAGVCALASIAAVVTLSLAIYEASTSATFGGLFAFIGGAIFLILRLIVTTRTGIVKEPHYMGR